MSAREPLPPRGERAGERRERALIVLRELEDAYPDAHCALTFDTPFQLLIATILSAQCTDARVNMVTPALFERFPGPHEMADAPIAELEDLVRSTGFFRQKAQNIQATGRRIVDDFAGVMPETVDELKTMPGAARKTANVVVSNCFPENAAGIAVDTHVQRIARRLALTRSWEPERIERDLMRDLPREWWNIVTHLMIDHGRAVCTARSPQCGNCPLAHVCPTAGRFG